MTETEEWRPVPGFEGYDVSSSGEVRRVGRALKLIIRNGYATVNLSDGEKRRAEGKVHRLVLAAFVGPCPEGNQCRHLDGNRLNNSLANLAWGTPAENGADRVGHGTQVRGDQHHFRRDPSAAPRGARNGLAKMTDSKVGTMRWCLQYVRDQSAIGRVFGMCQSGVSAIHRRKTWAHLT